MGMHLLQTLRQSSSDIRLLWFSVFMRMIAFGLTNQVLALYLKTLGITESQIGLFMTLTMVGDSFLSYYLTWNANRFGNRRIMQFGTLLMLLCGAVFATGTENFHILLVAAIFGVISPAGGDTGPFKTIEEAVLAKLTPPNHRPEVYAVHGMLSAIGSACGNSGTGFFVHYLVGSRDLSYRESYRLCFFPFCVISLIKFSTMFFLSSKCEAGYVPHFERKSSNSSDFAEQTNEEITAAADAVADVSERATETTPLVSTIEHRTATGLSPKSQNIMIKLLIPFMIDSFGYGFMPSSWAVYYFKVRYVASAMVLGLIFGSTDLIQSLAAVPSAWLSKRLGPVKGSLATQIPCGTFFLLLPFLGTTLGRGALFYILNQATSAMDVVPRQILLTSLIDTNDLARVMGTVNIGKQAARSISPTIAGILAQHGYLGICFVLAGGLLIISNVILAVTFKGVDEEIEKKQSVAHTIQ